MAEEEIEQTNAGKLQKQILPIMIGACVATVLGIFLLGYQTLTVPEPIPDDIRTIMEKAKSTSTLDKAVAEEATDIEKLSSSNDTFDFSKYRYYTFPLPFISNLASGKGMLTLEIAIATYGDSMDGEEIIELLETSNPKLRSAINFRLSEQTLIDVNTVVKRQKLSKILLKEVKLVVTALNADPSTITDLHLIKFVLSGVN